MSHKCIEVRWTKQAHKKIIIMYIMKYSCNTTISVQFYYCIWLLYFFILSSSSLLSCVVLNMQKKRPQKILKLSSHFQLLGSCYSLIFVSTWVTGVLVDFGLARLTSTLHNFSHSFWLKFTKKEIFGNMCDVMLVAYKPHFLNFYWVKLDTNTHVYMNKCELLLLFVKDDDDDEMKFSVVYITCT